MGETANPARVIELYGILAAATEERMVQVADMASFLASVLHIASGRTAHPANFRAAVKLMADAYATADAEQCAETETGVLH